MDVANFLEQLFLLEHLWWLLLTAESRKDFFSKKPGVGYKDASACDTGFFKKEFPGRLHLIKVKSGFYKIFTWVYFLRWEIKTDIAQICFCVLFKNLKNLILSLNCLTVDV